MPYPLTALFLLPNMTAVLTGACSMYSASCEALSLNERLSENCSKDWSTNYLKYVMISAFNLALIFSRHKWTYLLILNGFIELVNCMA
jgi:hypothetical protein